MSDAEDYVTPTAEEQAAIARVATALPRTLIDRAAVKCITEMLGNTESIEPATRAAVCEAITKRTHELIASPEYQAQIDEFIKARIASIIMGKLR